MTQLKGRQLGRAGLGQVLQALVLYLTSGVLIAAMAWAQQPVTLPGNTDVRVVVDISGSMKINDPDNLRRPAVRLLARMLPSGTTAGVWTFGQYVNMLVPHGEVNDGWRTKAIERSDEISSVALRTNLGEALEVASDGYYTAGDLSQSHFILLTDGKVDISETAEDNDRERERVLGKLLSELKERGATIHAVALSDEADLELLQAFARQTGGSYTIAESADELNLAFLQALNTAVPQEQIPIEGNGFLVDSGVSEFTALIFPGDTAFPADVTPTVDATALQLIDPNGVASSAESPAEGVRWVSEPGYDLITVSSPGAGDWAIEGQLGEGSRVTVVSDLRMAVSPIPPRFTADEPVTVEAMFYEQDETITDPDFLGVIEVTLTLTSEDGRSGSKPLSAATPPDDGIYRDRIARLPQPGDYRLDLVADGQTFSRKFSQVVTFEIPADGAPTAAAEAIETPPLDEPMVPDLAGQAELADLPPPTEPPAETPEAQAAVPDAGPVDLSAVEMADSPVADPSMANAESESALTLDQRQWFAIAAVVALCIVGGLGWWGWRRKRAVTAKDEPAEAAPDTEVAPQMGSEPEPEPEPEVTPEAKTETETETEASQEPESMPELDLAEQVEAPEELPATEEAVPQLDEPVAEAEQPAGEESTPEQGEEDEEFGLEDFDLSEIEDFGEGGEPVGEAETERSDEEKTRKSSSE